MTSNEPRQRPKQTDDESAETGPDRPRVEDAMAVNSVPDDVRMHGDPDETGVVQRNDGALVDVEDGDTDPLADDQDDGDQDGTP